jgi:hypothetical protein
MDAISFNNMDDLYTTQMCDLAWRPLVALQDFIIWSLPTSNFSIV